MLDAIFLVFVNEFRLLAKDRVGMFMLVLAPVVIITVAGFSLGNIYGARPSAHAYVVPVVDQDRGAVAHAIIDGLTRERSIDVAKTNNLAQARRIVGGRDRAPIAIVIPAGTSRALEDGGAARLELYVDPVRRLEVNAIELRLNELCRQITAGAQARARSEIEVQDAEIRARLKHLATQVKQVESAMHRYRRQLVQSRARAKTVFRSQMRQAIDALEKQTQAEIDQATAQTRSALTNQMASRRDALLAVRRYLDALRTSERDFVRWFATLKAAAGSRSADIPPLPAFPPPPASEQLAELSKPLELPHLRLAPQLPAPPNVSIKFPDLPSLPHLDLPRDRGSLVSGSAPALPGDLAWSEQSLTGGSAQANAFDQYVPGFGITFLFIAMLMAIGMGLIDERDWGTLQRLRVSGAPLVGVIIGKLLSRFLVGVVQMILLFAFGWWMFGISLGRDPIMLLLPTAAICFAAATISLLIACIARTHDSVMPVGAVVAMAMSAIGGCWWPLDFEPAWMRALAQWLPTTWTMRAYNDLMIRHLQPASALWPSVVTAGLAVLYLVVGMIAASKLYE